VRPPVPAAGHEGDEDHGAEEATEAMRLAAHKLPVATRIVQRETAGEESAR
jgi:ribosomal protein L16/L10AE